MRYLIKIAAAVLVGLLLTSVVQAGRGGGGGHGGGHGGHGGGYFRGGVGRFQGGGNFRGGVGRFQGRSFAARWRGGFSHRWWDRRFNRWMYFNPGWGGWYWSDGDMTTWNPVDADYAPPEPDETTPFETVPPDNTPPSPSKLKGTPPADDDP
jgi:hypothetical protein